MPRNLDSGLAAALSANLIYPAIMAILTFKSSTRYVHTGYGNIVYNGNTYQGVGSFGGIGSIVEGTEVNADGTTITLSGIDPVLQAEAMTDIQLGAPVTIMLALFTPQATMIGVPYVLFKGTVDKPTVTISPGSVSISLALENQMINLQRSTQRRYTSADQHLQYPTDTGFAFVEILNDQALVWGN